MNEVLLIAGMAAVTFGVRYPVLALVSKIPLPEGVFRALRFVPPAVLTAIIAPAVLLDAGDRLDISLNNSFLMAAVVSSLVAWRSRNLLLTIATGMGTLWAWRWLLSALAGR